VKEGLALSQLWVGSRLLGCTGNSFNSRQTPACFIAQTTRGILLAHMAHNRFRNFELSLQSPLHHSIALLVHNRSCVHTPPCKGHTLPFKLQSQEGLLAGARGSAKRTAERARGLVLFHTHRAVTHSRAPFQAGHSPPTVTLVPLCPTSCSAAAGSRPPRRSARRSLTDGTRTCTAGSLAVTEAINVVFPSSADWYA